MHYTFFIKDKHHLKVKRWAGEGRGKKKGNASRYILTESVWQSSGTETETLVMWTIDICSHRAR